MPYTSTQMDRGSIRRRRSAGNQPRGGWLSSAPLLPPHTRHDTHPMGQWTSAGPVAPAGEMEHARLTWVHSGTVETERDGTNYIGASTHTNNTGELTAMSVALARARENLHKAHDIRSDSRYTINMTTGRWMPSHKGQGLRNATIIERLRAQYRALQRDSPGIVLTHVRSHVRIPGNELADCLAECTKTGGCKHA